MSRPESNFPEGSLIEVNPILDHGYCRLIETWGSDERIIEAARMSTSGSFRGWDTDAKLLSYLYTNRHMSPFEMCGAVFEIQAPIFVFREWHRHRTQSYNELSARYMELPDLAYIPSIERLMNGKQGTKNKQSSDAGFDRERALALRASIEEGTKLARDRYIGLLASGVARELARLVVPLNQYSRMRASANLRNWLQFLELRQAEGAQLEIRVYAEAVHDILKEHFPRTLALFDQK